MRFSVIIPVYNVAPYLRECLDSIVAAVEKYGKPAELICIDDGSTDGCGAILDAYNPTTTLIDYKIQHQPNAGVSVARNKGLEVAGGDYICFVDGDDYVKDDWLLHYSDAIEKYKPDIVRIGESSGLIENLEGWLWDSFVEKGMPWMYVVRREVAILARFPEGVSYSEDALYAMRLVPHVKSAAEISYNGYVYRPREGSASLSRFTSYERLRFIKELYTIGQTLGSPKPKVFSRACSIQVVIWAMNPLDVDCRKEIRAIYVKMCSLGWPRIGAMAIKRWIPYLTYRYTGFLWPSMVWAWVVAFLVEVKKIVYKAMAKVIK